jgi:hypothetical protein
MVLSLSLPPFYNVIVGKKFIESGKYKGFDPKK